MVYVGIEPHLPALQPKYAGPTLVLEIRGKVVTIKWLNNGFVERVSADRIKPVHKLREEFRDLTMPDPERTTWLIQDPEAPVVIAPHGLDLISHSSLDDFVLTGNTDEPAMLNISRNFMRKLKMPSTRRRDESQSEGGSVSERAGGQRSVPTTQPPRLKAKKRKQVAVQFHRSDSPKPSTSTPIEQTQAPGRNTRAQKVRRLTRKQRKERQRNQT